MFKFGRLTIYFPQLNNDGQDIFLLNFSSVNQLLPRFDLHDTSNTLTEKGNNAIILSSSVHCYDIKNVKKGHERQKNY